MGCSLCNIGGSSPIQNWGAAHLPLHLHQSVQIDCSFAAHVVELLLLVLQHLLGALLPLLQLLQLLKQEQQD